MAINIASYDIPLANGFLIHNTIMCCHSLRFMSCNTIGQNKWKLSTHVVRPIYFCINAFCEWNNILLIYISWYLCISVFIHFDKHYRQVSVLEYEKCLLLEVQYFGRRTKLSFELFNPFVAFLFKSSSLIVFFFHCVL